MTEKPPISFHDVESKISSEESTNREKEILKTLCRGLRPKEAVKVIEADKNGIDNTSREEIRHVVAQVFDSEVTPTDVRKAILKELGNQGVDQHLLHRIAGHEI